MQGVPLLNEDKAQLSVTEHLPLAVCLMGPTAAGKTDLALSLTERMPFEIVSVDSALIYRGMDIGTAKPDKTLLARAPHRLIDIIEPSETYSVARFYQDALKEMQAITAAGKVPLLVGGTMMYYRIIQQGIANLPSADEQVREQILQEAAQHGWPYLHELLAKVDPESAQRIKPGDPQRLQRALEVYRVTGKTMTQIWQEQAQTTGKNRAAGYTENDADNDSAGLPALSYRFLNLSIAPQNRKELHERIAQRFDAMLANGFVEEVKTFYHDESIHAEMPSMRCVGYRQVWDYLDGNLSYDSMRERGIIATRQLAKRQLTWLRAWPNLYQLDTNDTKVLAKALKIVENAAY